MARSRKRSGCDLAWLCLESGYIHRGEAPSIDVLCLMAVVLLLCFAGCSNSSRVPGRVSEWCYSWWMKLNASKTKTMIVSRRHTIHPQAAPFTIGRRSLMTRLYWEWHLIPNWPLKSILAGFLEQLFKILGILRKSWQVFHDRSLLERCFRGFVLPVLEQCSAVWCSPADTHLKTTGPCSQWCLVPNWGCLSVTLFIVDLLQFSVCCIWSGVTRCTRLMMRYLDRMCQWGLHAVPWSHIGILLCHLAAEPRSTAGLLFPSQCHSEWSCWPRIQWCGTGGFQEQGQCFFIGLSCYIPTIFFYYFFLSLLPVYRLVLLWGWGLRTDMVYITLSQALFYFLFFSSSWSMSRILPINGLIFSHLNYCSSI